MPAKLAAALHHYHKKLECASKDVDLDASHAQREAGNARLGHVHIHGLDISVEWPKGSVRTGVDKDGKVWRREMKAAYGYLKRTVGGDSEQLDVYLGPQPESEIVFVVDQLKEDGSFDECKSLIGWASLPAAKEAYLAHYPSWWRKKRIGKIVPMTMARFKEWAFSAHAGRPAAHWKKAASSSLYHGSPTPGLTTLEPRPSRVLNGEAAVFGTPDRDTALTFSAPWRDEDLEHGSVNGQSYMREQYPTAFEKIFGGRRGYIYRVDQAGFGHDPRLTQSERVNRSSVPVVSAEEIADVLKAIRKSRFMLLRHGEKAPWDDGYPDIQAKKADAPELSEVNPYVSLTNETGFSGAFERTSPETPNAVQRLFEAIGGRGGHDVYSHLPRIRLPDTAVGVTLGAGAGGLYHLIRERLADTRHGDYQSSRRRRLLTRLLAGAAAGAGAANVIGDRTRRYLTNVVEPFGYKPDTSRVMPKSWRQFFDAALADRPTFGTTGDSNTEARHELLRRQFGVHTPRPELDVWAPNPDGSLSLNPRRIDSSVLVKDLLTGDPSSSMLFQDPRKALVDANTRATANRDTLMTPIVGGQMASEIHIGEGRSLLGVRDRWDYTLNPLEQNHLNRRLSALLHGDLDYLRSPLREVIDKAYISPQVGTTKTNWDVLKLLGIRELVNKFVVHRDPWVSQYLDVARHPGGGYSVTPLTGGGHTYPALGTMVPR